MRILVTGSRGFVGRHLLPALADRFPHAEIAPFDGSVAEKADVTDADTVDSVIASVKPSHVVHLAAVSSVPEAQADPRRTFAVNQGGTLNLALSLLRHVPDARLLVVSSSEVYGRAFAARCSVREDCPLQPTNVYAASKAAAEMTVRGLTSLGLRVLIARPFSHTGPGQSLRFALPSFASQIVNAERGAGEPVLRTGRLDPVRDFSDVRDVVAAYALLLAEFDRFENGTAVNVASGIGRSIGDLLDILVRLARVAVRLETDPGRMRPQDLVWTVGDSTLLRETLGWQPRIPIERTLGDLLDSLRTQGAGH